MSRSARYTYTIDLLGYTALHYVMLRSIWVWFPGNLPTMWCGVDQGVEIYVVELVGVRLPL